MSSGSLEKIEGGREKRRSFAVKKRKTHAKKHEHERRAGVIFFEN